MNVNSPPPMHMTSSVLVRSNLERVWSFIVDERNAPRWDRSVARAELLSPSPLRVGSIVQTTAPSGMVQQFRVDEISPSRVLRFSLLRSPWFRTAQLTFRLAPVEDGVSITHDIAVAFRFPWAILMPVLALFKKRALGADLESLRRAIDEGLDLTVRNGA
ncbi:SRPBCC family protein [Frateuria sp. YIM B11624]|uniref:SRPBCC family protein n=1 Tax=Frateuria sp. YIM B11624 TaxID=3143185 RepID=UPI003C78F996